MKFSASIIAMAIAAPLSASGKFNIGWLSGGGRIKDVLQNSIVMCFHATYVMKLMNGCMATRPLCYCNYYVDKGVLLQRYCHFHGYVHHIIQTTY